MIVIYVEKENLAAKIAAALGGFDLPDGTHISFKDLQANIKAVEALQKRQGYLDITFDGKPTKVTWGSGHQYGLCDASDYNPAYKSFRARPECFIPESFKLKPLTAPDMPAYDAKLAKLRKVTKELFEKAEYIINATDDDREGELIFAYIYEYNKCKTPYKRVYPSSWAESGIIEAFHKIKPSSDVHNIEMAGRARSLIDWMIGTNLSARMTVQNPGNDVLSVGRVQTVVQRMVVDRELAIRAFKSEPFWTIEGTFTTASGDCYKGKHQTKRFDRKADAEAVMKELGGASGAVTNLLAERTRRTPPLLYSGTQLQMDANDKYGFPAERTEKIAQWLYENGYTTYPRTSSQYLNDDMRPTLIDVLSKLEAMPEYTPYLSGIPKEPSNRFFDSRKVESHFAIIPTGETPKKLTPEQQKIYDLIAKSVIRTIYSDAILENTTVTTQVKAHQFVSRGVVTIDKGWMSVDTKIKDEILPVLKKADVVSGSYICKDGKTEPPRRYTDKTLLAAMKTAGKDLPDEELKKIMADPKVDGIGRESSRTNIITTLINRGYINRKGKQFYATEKGIEFISVFPIDELSAEYTARMEKSLYDIAHGTGDYNELVEAAKEETRRWCSEIANYTGAAMHKFSPAIGGAATSIKCPLCGGHILAFGWGWGCENHNVNGCSFFISNNICGKSITETTVRKIAETGSSNLIKGFVSKKTGEKFDAYLRFDGEKISFSFEEPVHGPVLKCPICGKRMVKHRWGWGCEGYKHGCHFSVENEICGKKMTASIVKRIVETGTSGVLKGFISKYGNRFDAELIINGTTTKMIFPDKK